MGNILWKKNTAGIFVLILLAAGTFTLSGVPIANLVRGQTNGNNTSEIQVAQSQVEEQQLREQQEEQKEQRAQEEEKQRPNHVPRANAGSDKKVQEGTNIILDARRSSDPDGDQVTYLWKQTSGPRVTIENTTAMVASFVAPDVNRDTTLTFLLTVRDYVGAQDTETVKFSIKNVETQTVTLGTNNGNSNNNIRSGQTNTNTNTKTNQAETTTTNGLDNTTSQALLNMQNTIRNNASRATTPNPSETQLSKATVFTPQAISTAVSAVQADNIVNTRTAYDIVFKTASAGAIKTVEMTFPSGTNIGSATMLEVSGIGPGGTSSNGQTLTYTVTNPVSVPVNVFLRFEVWKILNPPTPGTYTVQVVTKNEDGGTIDSGTSATYQIKQITTNDIGDNAITSAKIFDGQVGTVDLASNAVTGAKILDSTITSADIAPGTFSGGVADNSVTSAKIVNGEVKTVDLGTDAVTTDKIATDAVTANEISGVSKLVFTSCNVDAPTMSPDTTAFVVCNLPTAALGDHAMVTYNGHSFGGTHFSLQVVSAQVIDGQVHLLLRNTSPDITIGGQPSAFSIILYQ